MRSITTTGEHLVEDVKKLFCRFGHAFFKEYCGGCIIKAMKV